MTKQSAEASAGASGQPIHVFDQTNGVLRDEVEVDGSRARRGAARGDLPMATGLLLNGTN